MCNDRVCDCEKQEGARGCVVPVVFVSFSLRWVNHRTSVTYIQQQRRVRRRRGYRQMRRIQTLPIMLDTVVGLCGNRTTGKRNKYNNNN